MVISFNAQKKIFMIFHYNVCIRGHESSHKTFIYGKIFFFGKLKTTKLNL